MACALLARLRLLSHKMISTACLFYLPLVVEVVNKEWRGDLVPLVMAQMTQESACDPLAQSPYAMGLMQITPPTASDLEKGICQDQGKAKLFDARWSVVCGVRYDIFLYRKMPEYKPAFERFAAMLSSYNGGRGWVNRDNRICRQLLWCNHHRWYDNVEITPDPRRADWAIKENRGYPRRIQKKLLPKYQEALCG